MSQARVENCGCASCQRSWVPERVVGVVPGWPKGPLPPGTWRIAWPPDPDPDFDGLGLIRDKRLVSKHRRRECQDCGDMLTKEERKHLKGRRLHLSWRLCSGCFSERSDDLSWEKACGGYARDELPYELNYMGLCWLSEDLAGMGALNDEQQEGDE